MPFRARLLALLVMMSLMAAATYAIIVPALCGVFRITHHH
jgi:hypothetical protein